MADLIFDDDKKSRYKLSRQNLRDLEQQEQGMRKSLSSIQIPIPQDRPILSHLPKETEIIFVNDGSRFFPSKEQHQSLFHRTQMDSISFVEKFLKYRTELFFLIEVLYCGACFLGLLFLPTEAFDPVQAVPIALNTTSYPYTFYPSSKTSQFLTESNFAIFSFVLFYSHRAAKSSYAFQVLATFNVCSCIAKFMDQIEIYNHNTQITWAILKRTIYAILAALCIHISCRCIP
jgi:hypothetical protein